MSQQSNVPSDTTIRRLHPERLSALAACMAPYKVPNARALTHPVVVPMKYWCDHLFLFILCSMPSRSWAVVVRLGQKVSDLQPEHFGQLGKVLWTWVAAASFPSVDVPAINADNVANVLQSEPACLAGDFDPFANTEGF